MRCPISALPAGEGCPPAGLTSLGSGKEIHRYDGGREARSFSFTPDGNFAVAESFRAALSVFRLPSENGTEP